MTPSTSIRHWSDDRREKDKDTFEIRDQAPPIPVVPQHSLPATIGDAAELARQAALIVQGIVSTGLTFSRPALEASLEETIGEIAGGNGRISFHRKSGEALFGRNAKRVCRPIGGVRRQPP